MIPCSTPTSTTTTAVITARSKLSRTFAPDARQPAQVDQLDSNDENDGAQHAARQKLQWLRQEQQYQRDHDCGRNLRQLAAAARALDHRGLGRTAVDDERATESGDRVRSGQSDQVVVLVQLLMMPRRIEAGRGRALRKDHDEARSRNSHQHAQVMPAGVRNSQVRQPAGDAANDGNSALLKVPRSRWPRPRPPPRSAERESSC